MKRIAIGAVTGLAVWFGSALAAEAQQITPTGPMSYAAGSTLSTYTATIYLPTPMAYKVVTCLYKNGVYQTTFSQIVPNPGTNYSAFSQPCQVTFSAAPGDVITYTAVLYWNRTITSASNWNITVTGTRPPSKPESSAKRTNVGPKGTGLDLQNISADRRREQ